MLCKTIHRRDVCTTFFLFKMLIICDIHSRIFLLRREVSRTYHVNTRLRWRVRDPWKGKTSALPLLRVDGKNFRRLRKQPELLRKTVFFCVREVFTVTKIHKSMKRTIEGMDFFSRFFSFQADSINKPDAKRKWHDDVFICDTEVYMPFMLMVLLLHREVPWVSSETKTKGASIGCIIL